MSDEQDQSQKTEDPTAHKLEEARKKGQVVLSREVVTWFVLTAATLSILYVFPRTAGSLADFLSNFMYKFDQVQLTPENLQAMSMDWLLKIIQILALPFALIMFFGIMGTGLQTRFLVSMSNIEPKLEKISIGKGLKRLFSVNGVLELVKGLIKICLVGMVLLIVLRPALLSVESYVVLTQAQVLGHLYALSSRLFIISSLVMFVIAVFDYLYQRHDFMKKMMMSRHDLQQEMKQTEGDPHIRARLRQIRAERAKNRMMSAVPKATVIIANPTHFAVALHYESATMAAPVLVAKGADLVALKIREVAVENRIPIVQNPPLARSLYKELSLDDEIPPAHYKAVAEVIRFVMELKAKKSLYN